MRIKGSGFTLTEILIVVMILAIVSSASIPLYRKTMIKVRDREAKSMLSLIAQAEEAYRTQTGGCTNCPKGGYQCNDLLGLKLSQTNWVYAVSGEPSYNIVATSTGNNPPSRTCTYNRGEQSPACDY